MPKQAVIIYGPPGGGKGTQAELLERRGGFIHFDTGHYIEALVHDTAYKNNPVIRRERQNFDSGKLCTPSWVLKIIEEKAAKIAAAGENIVLSGSPRTMFETFGDDKKKEGLLKFLIKLYGKDNIFVIRLKVAPATSIKRNSARLICSVCGLPALGGKKLKRCAFCDAPFRKRTLDKPEIIKVRLKEYENRTYPILLKIKKMKIRVKEINGEPAPYKVFKNILKFLKLK